MSTTLIEKITEGITPEDMKILARSEGLINLRQGLIHDRESAGELLNELLEQRREEMTRLGIETDLIETAFAQVSAAYVEAEKRTNAARLENLRAG